MSQPAIRVEGLWKDYVIGRQQRHAETFYELLSNTLSAPFRNGSSTKESDKTHFWALKDINFEVQPGEVVGVIGRNGAGKSTLLKILSRITAPTKGRVEVRGRLASLLEVGTGFHPELSGRENIFLNGAILGMTRAEVAKKFDEIVAFAEVEKFVDTPVKRYSSGMYVRLAFAVAAHLDCDVLIVDEVLAVGDYVFQKKCLEKMGDVAAVGRTVVLVSHNMISLQRLCKSILWLESGTVRTRGDTQIVTDYLAATLPTSATEWRPANSAPDSVAAIDCISIHDHLGRQSNTFTGSQSIHITVSVDVRMQVENLCVGFDLVTSDGSVIFRTYHRDDPAWNSQILPLGKSVLTTHIPCELLNSGAYFLSPRLSNHNIYWVSHDESVLRFDVVTTGGESTLRKSLGPNQWPGIVAPVFSWEIVAS